MRPSLDELPVLCITPPVWYTAPTPAVPLPVINLPEMKPSSLDAHHTATVVADHDLGLAAHVIPLSSVSIRVVPPTTNVANGSEVEGLAHHDALVAQVAADRRQIQRAAVHADRPEIRARPDRVSVFGPVSHSQMRQVRRIVQILVSSIEADRCFGPANVVPLLIRSLIPSA